jgi:hypothetical protein
VATTHLDVQALTICVGFVIPLLTSVVTKEKAPAWVKAVINALLGAIAGALVTAIGDNGNVVLGSWVTGIAEAFITSVASYFGLWKPSGVADAISLKTAGLGFGRKTPPDLPASAWFDQVRRGGSDEAIRLWDATPDVPVISMDEPPVKPYIKPSPQSPAPRAKAPAAKKAPAQKVTSTTAQKTVRVPSTNPAAKAKK